ncbi:MAG TPA: hypothetical protein VFV97_13950 [Rhodanobacteraceae bacterium]|nr:hypothetical protein [Rhodanobacteraceae bacterium]
MSLEDKTIAVVGVSDEETAHLRLLMRRAASELSHAWKWGSEANCDLLVVDPASFGGQMARTRAQSGGMRCAIFSDDPEVAGAELALHRPLKAANVVDVLNRAARMAERSEGIVPDRQDFWFRDVGEDAHDEALDGTPESPERENNAAPGLEELLRVDPVDAREAARIKTALDDRTTVFGTSGPTARSEVRGRESPDILARGRSDIPPEAVLVRRTGADPDMARNNLRVYLDGNLLGGPARVTLPDAPPLVLDPKLKVFHSPGRLAALEPYCRTPLRRADFQPLTSAELVELRAAEPPQPYIKLVWLYVLLHSEGKLARHLDPGGTYKLARWIEIERDFSEYFRIASTMLQPGRLHEIAAASSASMSDVFDVVNAYDAIGLIEWQPRTPRGGGEPVEEPKKGLLGRFRKSFKR